MADQSILAAFASVGAQGSAKEYITNFMTQYGLGALADTAWNQYLQGVPTDQIMLNLRSTPEYKTRYPAMDALAKQGQAISETDYIDWERTAKQALTQAGVPQQTGMYAPDYLGKFLAGGYSASEFADLVDTENKAANQGSEYRQQLEALYGPISNSDLTAFFIDPNKTMPYIKTQYQAGSIATQAARTGFGQLTTGQAEGLANQGITDAQAQQGFNQLDTQKELMKALPGESNGDISQQDQLDATFNSNFYAQQRIDQRRAQRTSQFGQGGNFAANQKGVSGIGTAQSQ